MRWALAGGRALLWFTRRVPLPSEALYPLRTLACALLLFAAATLARGSGFLAVFAAGIVMGDERAPFKREIERFHTALASLAEIVAFVALGLTVDLADHRRAPTCGYPASSSGPRSPSSSGRSLVGTMPHPRAAEKQ